MDNKIFEEKEKLQNFHHSKLNLQNFIFYHINNEIIQTNSEIINRLKFMKMNKYFSSIMKLNCDENNIKAKEIMSLIQSYFLDIIKEEQESFFKNRNIIQNANKLTKIKILELMLKKLNVVDQEFLLMNLILIVKTQNKNSQTNEFLLKNTILSRNKQTLKKIIIVSKKTLIEKLKILKKGF